MPEPGPGTCYLADIASRIRSKNAGPYELIFDTMFDDQNTHTKLKKSGILCRATIARLYHIADKDIVASLF